jgi:hypothetical protein
MKRTFVLASLAAAVALAAPAVHAQSADALADAAPAAIQPESAPRAVPLPASLTPAPLVRAGSEALDAAARSAWKYPLRGAIIGAVAGAVWGTILMATADEYIGVPAHAFTVPGGALLGLAVGGAMNVIDPP